jgi:hypothetical protein
MQERWVVLGINVAWFLAGLLSVALLSELLLSNLFEIES